MVALIDTGDLVPFADIDAAKADAMVTHATALATRAAPCLTTSTDPSVLAAAKAILVGVILRWNDSGVASYQVQSAGPELPGTDNRQRRNMLWPSEVDELRSLCASAGTSTSNYTLSLAGE